MTSFKPQALKVLSGTVRKDRVRTIVDWPLVTEPPAPPDWLDNRHAIAEWARLTQILLANRMLTTTALSALAHLCAWHGAIVSAYEKGETPPAAAITALRGLCADFGLTPVAQTRVSPSSEAAKVNPFLEFVEPLKPKRRR